ncbi:MAG: enoyl-CoA hydratase/isomerase family protein [Sphingobium sp.]
MTDLGIVSLDWRDAVAVLTLNVPERRNVLSLEVRTALRQRLSDLYLDASCRAIVLTGAGGHFCAGGDIGEMREGRADPLVRLHRLGILHDLIRAIVAGPKPVVAAVAGAAAGAGFSLAAACDVVVADPGASFIASFAKVGLAPDCGIQFTLGRRVGAARAHRILLGAQRIDAAEAQRIGLADIVAGKGVLLDQAVEAATGYAGLAPQSLAAIKAAYASGPGSLEDVLALEREVQARLALTADHAEAKAAFLERREPLFRGE